MNTGGHEGAQVDFSTARGRDWPGVRQFNVFVENRLGGLMNVVRRFGNSDNQIISLTVVDSADCAIIRMVLADPERAFEVFKQARLPFTESTLLVVKLPETQQPLLDLFKAMLVAEIDIHYAYPIMIHPVGSAALAIHVEDIENAAATLEKQGFELYSENDLKDS